MMEVARSISHDEHIIGAYSLEGAHADEDAEDEENPKGTALQPHETPWDVVSACGV